MLCASGLWTRLSVAAHPIDIEIVVVDRRRHLYVLWGRGDAELAPPCAGTSVTCWRWPFETSTALRPRGGAQDLHAQRHRRPRTARRSSARTPGPHRLVIADVDDDGARALDRRHRHHNGWCSSCTTGAPSSSSPLTLQARSRCSGGGRAMVTRRARVLLRPRLRLVRGHARPVLLPRGRHDHQRHDRSLERHRQVALMEKYASIRRSYNVSPDAKIPLDL